MDNIAIFFEHVHLLNGLDGLDVHLLKGGLELLIVGAGGLVDLLHLAARGTFSSIQVVIFLSL